MPPTSNVQRIEYARFINQIAPLATWQSVNPILYDGEIALVRVGNFVKFKIGDGVTAFNSLAFNVFDPSTLKGKAITTTNPGTPAAPEFWIGGPGTYTNFGGQIITGQAGFLIWDTVSWSVVNVTVDLTAYVAKTDIVNDFSGGATKVLSAEQGKTINGLFVKTDITGAIFNENKYVQTTDGVLKTSTSGTPYTHTDWIPVVPGQKIYYTGSCKGTTTNPSGLAGYTSKTEGSFLSTLDGFGLPIGALWDNRRYAAINGLNPTTQVGPITHTGVVITVPANCNFIRASSEMATFQVYINILQLVDQIVLGRVGYDNITGNVFSGYAANIQTGANYPNVDFYCTDFIPVKPGQIVYFSGRISNFEASGTAKGVAGYSAANAGSFVSTAGTDGLKIGDIFGIDRAVQMFGGSYGSTTRYTFSNVPLKIPAGVNYIRAASAYADGVPVVVRTARSTGTLKEGLSQLQSFVYFDKTATKGVYMPAPTGPKLFDANDSQGLTKDATYYYHSGAHFIEKRAISDPGTVVLTKNNPAGGNKIGGLFYDAIDNVILVMGGTYESPYETHFYRINPLDLSDIMTVDVTPFSNWGCNAICRFTDATNVVGNIRDFIYIGETAAAENGLKRILQFDANMNFIQYAFSDFSKDGENDYQDMEVVDGFIYCTDHVGNLCIFEPQFDGRLKRIAKSPTYQQAFHEGICRISGNNFIMRGNLTTVSVYPVTLNPYDLFPQDYKGTVTVAASGTTTITIPFATIGTAPVSAAPGWLNVTANNAAAASGGAIVRQYADLTNIYVVHATIPTGSLTYNIVFKRY